MGYSTVHTVDPENVQYILATRFNDYEYSISRVHGLGDLFGDGIVTSNGDQWRHSRSILRPCFPRLNDSYLKRLESHVKDFVTLLPRDHSTVDLQNLFFPFTMDITIDFLFGQSTYILCSSQANRTTYAEFVDAYSELISEATTRVKLGHLQYIRYFRGRIARRRVNGFVDALINNALRSGLLDGDGKPTLL